MSQFVYPDFVVISYRVELDVPGQPSGSVYCCDYQLEVKLDLATPS